MRHPNLATQLFLATFSTCALADYYSPSDSYLNLTGQDVYVYSLGNYPGATPQFKQAIQPGQVFEHEVRGKNGSPLLGAPGMQFRIARGGRVRIEKGGPGVYEIRSESQAPHPRPVIEQPWPRPRPFPVTPLPQPVPRPIPVPYPVPVLDQLPQPYPIPEPQLRQSQINYKNLTGETLMVHTQSSGAPSSHRPWSFESTLAPGDTKAVSIQPGMPGIRFTRQDGSVVMPVNAGNNMYELLPSKRNNVQRRPSVEQVIFDIVEIVAPEVLNRH